MHNYGCMLDGRDDDDFDPERAVFCRFCHSSGACAPDCDERAERRRAREERSDEIAADFADWGRGED